jgi:hypothetical protein
MQFVCFTKRSVPCIFLIMSLTASHSIWPPLSKSQHINGSSRLLCSGIPCCVAWYTITKVTLTWKHGGRLFIGSAKKLLSIYWTRRLHNPESVSVRYSHITQTSLFTALYYRYLFCQFKSFRMSTTGLWFRSCGMWRCVLRRWVPPTVSRKHSPTGTVPNQTRILSYTTVKNSNCALWTSIRKYIKLHIYYTLIYQRNCI